MSRPPVAYYNEIDPHAAQWLRNLIDAGHIAPGVIDERSIEDVCPRDLDGFAQCHFFAGIGGWSLGLRLAGWPDDRPVWTGSCPCQPFSAAGKGVGVDDERHLWPALHHLIGQCRPPVVLGEQVEAAIRHGWLDLVRADLEGDGYAFGAIGLPAACVTAPHARPRVWWVADSKRNKQPRGEPCGGPAGRVGRVEQPLPWDEPWPDALARFRAMGDGVPRCVEGTDAARNSIVPHLAATFVRATMKEQP